MTDKRIVGLIPAAGRATRLQGLNSSKEVVPVGTPPRPVASGLIEQMVRAGASEIYFVLRQGKWDIPATFGHGRDFGVHIAYLLMDEPWGPPFTLRQALPFCRDATVLVGFPDILIKPCDAFARAVEQLHNGSDPAIVGTFAARQEDGCDLVKIDGNGKVIALLPKERGPVWPDQALTWLFAAWRPAFSCHFEQCVAQLASAAASGTGPEAPLGLIFEQALARGLSVDSIHFETGRFLDVGEPQRLAAADGFFTGAAGPQ